MALSGLDIYKVLPKTNCRECGFATCLAFAMQLAKKAVSIDKCPHVSAQAKQILEAASLPPIKLVSLGVGEQGLSVGQETVLFRHEEKFHHPCGLGIILDDTFSDADLKSRLAQIKKFTFERVGQSLRLEVVAIRQRKDAARFLQVVKMAGQETDRALVLISNDVAAIEEALKISASAKPLIFAATAQNPAGFASLAKQFKAPLVASATDLAGVSALTQELEKQGVGDLFINTTHKSVSDNIWDLTQIRRQALKKNNRSLGYPAVEIVESDDPYEETMQAASYICKYAGLVLIKGTALWQILALLTLRQNIYSDPQKPLQIEPGLYPIGPADEKSPVLVTTNFSLSYYTVLGEVEASKIPSYILTVDTEGMSVLTAWAAEKFNAEKITSAMNKFEVSKAVSHKNIIIPGYVAVMSGDLEESSGWKVAVGPKEAAGIPTFLKKVNF